MSCPQHEQFYPPFDDENYFICCGTKKGAVLRLLVGQPLIGSDTDLKMTETKGCQQHGQKVDALCIDHPSMV